MGAYIHFSASFLGSDNWQYFDNASEPLHKEIRPLTVSTEARLSMFNPTSALSGHITPLNTRMMNDSVLRVSEFNVVSAEHIERPSTKRVCSSYNIAHITL